MRDKNYRKALLTVKRLERAPGGSLSDAINSFSRQRKNALDPPSASAQSAYQGIPAEYFNRPELAIAQPEQEQRSTPMAQSADLGSALEDGVDWIQGKEKPKAPAASQAPPAGGSPREPGQASSPSSQSPSPANQSSPPSSQTPMAGPPASASSSPNSNYHYAMLNNPGNIGFGGWAQGHGAVTHAGWDTGHAIAGFPDLDTGYRAMSTLALGKYGGGAKTLNGLIAGDNGWTPGNRIAAANIARYMGVRPDEDLRLDSPDRLRAFQRALTIQETGSSAQFDAWSGAPAHERRQQASGDAAIQPQQRQAVAPDAPAAVPPQVPRGNLQITDPNPDPLTSHAYPAPTEHAGPQASINPQDDIMPDPTQTAAKGGSIKSTPSPELIAHALRILARRKAADGGAQTQVKTAPTLDSLNTQYQQLAAQQAQTQARQRAVDSQLGSQAVGQIRDANENGGRGGISNAIYEPMQMLGAIGNNVSPQKQNPDQPTPPIASGPAVQGQNIGNAAAATGAPLGNIPMASPGGTGMGGAGAGSPSYNNTLDEALGTNSPTMNQVFGYNYPIPPPPKPQAQGPVSQNEINALYGFGGGSQMGTGTFAEGGAIVMDALLRANRARKAKGKR